MRAQALGQLPKHVVLQMLLHSFCDLSDGRHMLALRVEFGVDLLDRPEATHLLLEPLERSANLPEADELPLQLPGRLLPARAEVPELSLHPRAGLPNVLDDGELRLEPPLHVASVPRLRLRTRTQQLPHLAVDVGEPRLELAHHLPDLADLVHVMLRLRIAHRPGRRCRRHRGGALVHALREAALEGGEPQEARVDPFQLLPQCGNLLQRCGVLRCSLHLANLRQLLTQCRNPLQSRGHALQLSSHLADLRQLLL
mmetsp:Transcript_170580/g.547158  ORF Transcript_170580/g.547158 Transcript_170580/m.547158 type:complete len:255 (-) Transcript_170580:3305-4069(-)